MFNGLNFVRKITIIVIAILLGMVILVKIPGPTFLWLFFISAITLIIIGKILINADGSTHYPMPAPKQFDPISLAALRGGRNIVIQTALFRLWLHDLLLIKFTNIDVQMKNLPTHHTLPESKIEAEIYQFAQVERVPSDFMTDSTLLSQIDQHLETIYAELERLHLKYDEAQLQRANRIAILIVVIIAVIGVIKLFLGITNDRPIEFLIILIPFMTFIAHYTLRPKTPITYLGKRYLKKVNKDFFWIKKSLKKNRDTEGVDPSYSIAIFGLSSIAGVATFDPFNTACLSIKGVKDDGSSWGGCGGGCGGGSGGGSGGGCGGCGGGGD